MTSWTITVPRCCPSLNVVLHEHWAAQRRLQAAWEKDIWALAHQAGMTKARGKRRLTIHRFGRHELDVDNLIGGLKGTVFDPLKRLGYLVDDSPAWLEIAPPQQTAGVVPAARRTVITLEEVG